MGLLSLTRREGERIVYRVGDVEFAVVVTEIFGGKVMLTTDAPPEIVILRGELLRKKSTQEK